MLCSVCIHAAVCEKLEECRDPLHFKDAITGEVGCSFFDIEPAETSFQEDLEFFVNDCTKAQLKVLYERVAEKLKGKEESTSGCETCTNGPDPCCGTCSNHGDCPHEEGKS